MFQKIMKNGILTVLLVVMSVALLYAYRNQQASVAPEDVSISTVAAEVSQGKVKKITVPLVGGSSWVQLSDGKTQSFVTTVSDAAELRKNVDTYNAGNPKSKTAFEYQQPSFDWGPVLFSLLPVLLIGGFFIYMMRQAQGPGNQALNFGKSKAKMFIGNKQNVIFADVAGCDEAKQEVGEIVDFLKYPEKFSTIGARIPKGVLLIGPPGTGKTLLARAIAGEAGVPFFNVSGSEFVEMFVGIGASRVRDLFDQAKRNSPCIVFVDEIDAVGRQRGAGLGGSHDEREQTLNQILTEMDGFEMGTNVIVIAATNRPDVLDPALIRPGRFDRTVVLDRPDIRGRKAILEIHAKGKPFEKPKKEEPDPLLIIAKKSAGLTGADLANILNEAAILAARRNKKKIGNEELSEAFKKVVMGPERKSRVIGDEEKRILAIHESGHAFVMKKTPLCDPVHEVSIVARGMAGGVTWSLPEDDQRIPSRARLLAEITGALGGRAAEEVCLGGFDHVTIGASNDLEKATELARKMVAVYGMSQKLGPQSFGSREMVFLGKQIVDDHDYSNETARIIDEEIKAIIDPCYEDAKKVIAANPDALGAMVRALVKEETLEGERLQMLLSG